MPTLDITRQDLLWPTLKALEKLGGSATNQELSAQIAEDLTLSEEILEITHNDGPQSEVDYRSAWARTQLKHILAVENTARGVWTITQRGREIDSDAIVRELAQEESRRRAQEGRRRVPSSRSEPEQEEMPNDQSWQEELLKIVRQLESSDFERLCQRILRESGFIKVEVTGRPGDQGIDGMGVLQVNLISFRVAFQCKRYTGTIPAREIRDFRGSWLGRSEKGLFITTGRFSSDAKEEAVRDGAPAIDLIDGTRLCMLLKDLGLGVDTQEVFIPKPEFFKSL